MVDNIFVNRFNKMTNEELEAISFNEDVYTNEARLTAIDILKNRGLNTDGINETHTALTAELLAEKKALLEHTLKAESPAPDDNDTKAKPLPELYSKTFILSISILFSPIFGSILLISNFKKMRLKTAVNHVIYFILAYLVIVVLISMLGINSNFALITNAIGGFVLTEYFWNTHLGKITAYKKRDWVKPVLIILAVTIPLTYFVLKSGGAL
ncbi:hypothetical protein [Formosa algae]|uniref:hypothetical protein n=1 Tax=Formosa algae TaxID=225843 RepID=UPI000CD09C9E|nr:hypothetical protein [Formosa algae]